MSQKTYLLIDNKWLLDSQDVNHVDSMLSVEEVTDKESVANHVMDITSDTITPDSYRAAQEISEYDSAISLSWSGLERVRNIDCYAHRHGIKDAVRDHNIQIESYSWTRK